MFTQCPECGTVFRVTAAVLRAAQGQVRCGVCDVNFDALRYLTDAVEGEVPAPAAPTAPEPPAEPPARVAPEPPASRPPAAAPASVRSVAATRSTPSADEDRELAEIAATLARDAHAAELSARLAAVAAARHNAAAAAASAAVAADTADDVNVLEPDDVEDIVLGGEGPGGEISEAALEFNVPPGEWDSVFVEDAGAQAITPLDINLGEFEGAPTGVAAEVSAAEQLLHLIDAPPAAAAPPAPAPRPPPEAPSAGELTLADDDPLSRTDEYALLELELADRHAVARPSVEPASAGEPEPAEIDIEGAHEDGGVHVEDTWFDHSHAAAVEPEHVPRQAVLRALPAPPVFELPIDESGPVAEPEPTATPRRGRALTAGIGVLALVFVAQIVHQNREALAASGLAGRPVRALYASLGRPIEPRWDLAAYDVKQWGAASDNAPGALRLRASVVNRANRAQPYPLLRVTLEDRFGARVARREFTPVEYLPGHAAPGTLLAPGARADADLSLADPGSQAVGFELDVCLPHAGVLTCGTEPKNPGAG